MLENRLDKDEKYAMSKIGKDSVYSFFVTDKLYGWLIAFAILAAQALILFFFVKASEANLQDDNTDIEFTWKCPRDIDVCSDKSDLENAGWFLFSSLMVAFLAKDLINGSKLIYHSSKARHTFGARTRYFIGGLSLCSITLYALYVSLCQCKYLQFDSLMSHCCAHLIDGNSIFSPLHFQVSVVYNHAIATSNTNIILNSVVVLFIMDMDEKIFAAIEAWNDKWTAHVAESEDIRSDSEVANSNTAALALEEMNKDIASQDEKIAAQQDEIRMLRDTMQQILDLESQAVEGAAKSESIPQCVNNDNENVLSPPSPATEGDNDIMKNEIESLRKEVQELRNLYKAEIAGTKQSYLASSSETFCDYSSEGETELENVSTHTNSTYDAETSVLLNANTIATHQDFVADQGTEVTPCEQE